MMLLEIRLLATLGGGRDWRWGWGVSSAMFNVSFLDLSAGYTSVFSYVNINELHTYDM